LRHRFAFACRSPRAAEPAACDMPSRRSGRLSSAGSAWSCWCRPGWPAQLAERGCGCRWRSASA